MATCSSRSMAKPQSHRSYPAAPVPLAAPVAPLAAAPAAALGRLCGMLPKALRRHQSTSCMSTTRAALQWARPRRPTGFGLARGEAPTCRPTSTPSSERVRATTTRTSGRCTSTPAPVACEVGAAPASFCSSSCSSQLTAQPRWHPARDPRCSALGGRTPSTRRARRGSGPLATLVRCPWSAAPSPLSLAVGTTTIRMRHGRRRSGFGVARTRVLAARL
mmetsp:Transcript_26749/g.67257  ORF Transcript_26749/g.67257 Transcript_26749/m.67257 type:complete len:219 (+) Transcript_26749:12-668(+)